MDVEGGPQTSAREDQPLLIQTIDGVGRPKTWWKSETFILIAGSIAVLGIGTGVGFATPIPSDLKEHHTLGVVSNVLGGIYFFAWSISFWPQVFLNYSLKSTVGMSYDYQAYNVIGYVAYSIFNSLFFWSPPVQRDYERHHHGKKNQVQASDVFFALHGVAVTIIICVQIVIYERGNQKVSKFCWGVCGLSVVVAALFAILCATVGHGFFIWLNFYELVADIKLLVTFIKYMPQVYMNYKRKSTAGMNVHNFLLDFLGGVLSVAQLMMDSAITHDWSAISGDAAKFGLGVIAMVFDTIIIIQHYVVYNKKRGAEDGHDSTHPSDQISAGGGAE
ncbi:hypothetical protein PTSG_01794 [Salpingoeca rosetta]|uniref:Cystinosin n=1 Tax=Salpingoeca rosetta (strain ATCC 50818 / BSB-021) TaxID=946362 RepID=F2TYZ5_SALR5|nr:uncharacterized protein PTSG_01794 [Salpingoeca rosetta]EGD78819.1 hypothetical protein PTSG_01794 [Salpingoeca rosetta]|eukprot:XP_004997775.1 hypothetical protein PTSG_01794 [Salpingoeca rosetta]